MANTGLPFTKHRSFPFTNTSFCAKLAKCKLTTGWLASADNITAAKQKPRASTCVYGHKAAPITNPNVACSKALLSPSAASHSLASCSSAPHYTCEHAQQQQQPPGRQSLPRQDPMGAPQAAPRIAVSHALREPLMASQQRLKQSAAQTRAPPPAASMLSSRDSRYSPKTSAHTIQVTCNTVFTKS